jgi:hypothetical protein
VERTVGVVKDDLRVVLRTLTCSPVSHFQLADQLDKIMINTNQKNDCME